MTINNEFEMIRKDGVVAYLKFLRRYLKDWRKPRELSIIKVPVEIRIEDK
jgi:hypothetical protein